MNDNIVSWTARQPVVSRGAVSWLMAMGALVPSTGMAAAPAGAGTVMVARSPAHPWVPMTVRTLADLPPIKPDVPSGIYGGIGGSDPKRAAGFFRTARIDGRWWLIEPQGRRFIHQGVASVRAIPTEAAQEALARRFGSQDDWARATAALLHENRFNGLGCWSDDAALKPASSRLVYTKLWNFMSAYGKTRGGTYQKPGHTGYPGDCPFFFDPGFPAFCDEHARQLAASKDDPWLLGHFTDNELPWSIELLDRYLKLSEPDPGRIAAVRWLGQRHGEQASAREITPQDRQDFVGFAADTYFRAVCGAIRKHDPNHLILGPRFHGSALKLAALFRTAGRHLDVVSVNYYHAWTPDPALLNSWSTGSGKPFLITEWYAKGADSGLANMGGAGWLVKSQQDRGLFYQNFTLGLLESGGCVGWHWFKYADNDPDDRKADPSNRDSNKGIVGNRYVPYQPLLDAMKEINLRTFGLIEHFDLTENP